MSWSTSGRYGSSPLTRGAPIYSSCCLIMTRLIPAHAGSTSRRWAPPPRPGAHPRSRGEHKRMRFAWATGIGSSPLTRGAPSSCLAGRVLARLIPAHAGSTGGRPSSGSEFRAHPRSRGEHSTTGRGGFIGSGSSPLTRGAQCLPDCLRGANRLIPAHAGSTGRGLSGSCCLPAHPRSRGEHCYFPLICANALGSSPLTRGAHILTTFTTGNRRLIPAHAGSTSTSFSRMRPVKAHPRSRGEHGSFT